MKEYTYSGENQRDSKLWQLAGFLAFIGISPVFLVTSISIFLVPLSSYPETSWNSVRLSLFFWTFLSFLLGFSIGSFFINYYPTIWTDNDAIYISYFVLLRIKIPWNEILDIKLVSSNPRTLLVRTRRITPWHIYYGFYYSQSCKPSFLIKGSIDNFDELTQVIKSNIYPRH
jgi:hypothetical protein